MKSLLNRIAIVLEDLAWWLRSATISLHQTSGPGFDSWYLGSEAVA